MKYSLIVAPVIAIALAACGTVDTTGLSATSSRTMLGAATATVTVTEFADFQCPACRSGYEVINKPLLAKYGNQIKFEFMHFPLRSIHAFAYEAAQAAECAADQGKFWEFVDYTYTHQNELSSSGLRAWAKTLGLDTALFERCVDSEIKGDTVMADYAEGEKAGVTGTPTYFVNGQKVYSSLEEISKAIDAAMTNTVPL